MRYYIFILCTLPLLLLCVSPVFSADVDLSMTTSNSEDPTNWLEEKLGENLPLDVEFVNSEGQTVILGDLIDRPTLVVPVYYNCRNVCNYLLGGLAKVLPEIKLEAGESYRVVTISFDTDETPELAKKSKQTFLAAMQGKYPPEAWDFLTGEDKNIRKVLDAAGYYYKKEGVDFLHPVAAFVVTGEGKIVRFLS